jgi:5-methylcytosine-specific restriction endonuclease McrA
MRTGDEVEVHHIVPRAVGGISKLDNLVVLHSECH